MGTLKKACELDIMVIAPPPLHKKGLGHREVE